MPEMGNSSVAANHPGFPVVRSCISSWRNAIITEKGAPCLSLHLSCPAVFDGNMQPMHFPTPWTRNILVPAVSHQRFRLSRSSFAFSRRYLTQVTFRLQYSSAVDSWKNPGEGIVNRALLPQKTSLWVYFRDQSLDYALLPKSFRSSPQPMIPPLVLTSLSQGHP